MSTEVNKTSTPQDKPSTITNQNTEEKKPDPDEVGELDLVFCMDCTASMSSYIESGQKSISSIVDKISKSEKVDVRFAYIAYRDHPPQDATFVTKVHEFTASPNVMHEYVKKYRAEGGGDGPEAVTAALHDALKLPYRKDAIKVVVLIADAPPHGIGASGDGFPKGDPNGHDPVKIANEMASQGIILYVVACEPSLSGYKNAHDLMAGLAKITEGRYLPLTSAHLLPDVIVGGAQEEVIMQKFEEQIALNVSEIQSKNPHLKEEEVVEEVAKKLNDKGHRYKQVEVADIYNGYNDLNVENISKADSLSSAIKHIVPIEQPKMNLLPMDDPSMNSVDVSTNSWDATQVYKSVNRLKKKSGK